MNYFETQYIVGVKRKTYEKIIQKKNENESSRIKNKSKTMNRIKLNTVLNENPIYVLS